MGFMKTLLCLMCLLCLAGAAEARGKGEKILEYWEQDQRATWREYIVVDTAYFLSNMPYEERAAYNGVAFPLYCGYVTFYPDGQVHFTKLTDLPIKHIVKFFDDIEKKRRIRISDYTQSVVDRVCGYDASRREVDQGYPELFQHIIGMEMMNRYRLTTVRLDWWREMPDLDYRPEYKNMCIYNAKKIDSCKHFKSELLNPGAKPVDSLLDYTTETQ